MRTRPRRWVAATLVAAVALGGCVPGENRASDRTGVRIDNRTDVPLLVEYELVPLEQLQGQGPQFDPTGVDPLGAVGAHDDRGFEPVPLEDGRTLADLVVRTEDGDEVVRLGTGLLVGEGEVVVLVRPEVLP